MNGLIVKGWHSVVVGPFEFQLAVTLTGLPLIGNAYPSTAERSYVSAAALKVVALIVPHNVYSNKATGGAPLYCTAAVPFQE